MKKRIFRLLFVAFCTLTSTIPLQAQWVQTNCPYSGKIWSFAVCGTNLFVGTNGEGVFRSSDNGATWTAVNVGIVEKAVYSFAVSPASGGTGGTNIFAGTNGSVYVSTNNGSSWNSISSGLPASYINALTVAPASGGTGGTNLWAGTGRGVFRSTNNGSTWTAAGLTGNSIYAVAVCGTNLWAASRTGSAGVAYCSGDNGMSWTGHVLSSRDVSAFAVSGANLFAGGYAGVHRTTNNGTNWTLSLASEIVYSLAVLGTNLFAGTYGGVSLSTDNGASWSAVSNGLTNPYINALVTCGTNLFAGTDAGVWKRPLSEMPISMPAAPESPVLCTPGDSTRNIPCTLTLNWAKATGAVTYRLQVSLSSVFSTTVINDSTITDTTKTIGPLQNNVTYYWRVSAKNEGGTSAWSQVRSFTTIVGAPQAPTLASPSDSCINMQLNTLVSWDAVPGATLYHLQVSTAATFAPLSVDDSTLSAASRSTGPLALATNYYWRVRAKNQAGWGPYSVVRRFSTIRTTSVEQAGSAVPTEYALSQNYPNPFNPSTAIQFALPKSSYVTLRVFDALGKEVTTLVSQDLSPGYFTVRWQASVPSGVYFYRLHARVASTGSTSSPQASSAREFVETKKTVLLR